MQGVLGVKVDERVSSVRPTSDAAALGVNFREAPEHICCRVLSRRSRQHTLYSSGVELAAHILYLEHAVNTPRPAGDGPAPNWDSEWRRGAPRSQAAPVSVKSCTILYPRFWP